MAYGRNRGQGPSTGQRFKDALDRTQRTGERAEDYAWEQMYGYDPSAAMREQVEAFDRDLFEKWNIGAEDLRGQSVGAGRTGSGFLDRDQGTLWDRAMEQRGRGLANIALQGEQLRYGNIGRMMDYGTGQTGRYLDLLAGERDAEFMERNLRMQEKANNPWLRLGEAALGGIGSVLGGWLGGR